MILSPVTERFEGTVMFPDVIKDLSLNRKGGGHRWREMQGEEKRFRLLPLVNGIHQRHSIASKDPTKIKRRNRVIPFPYLCNLK